jgi:transposase
MQKRTKITNELKQQIISFYLVGSTIKECSKYFNVSRSAIDKVLKKVDKSNLRRSGVPLSEKLEKEIIEFYLEGNSHYKISEKFGTSRKTSLEILKKFDIKRRRFEEIHRIYSLKEDYFENIDTEDKAYFLGLLIADGYNNNRQFTLSLQEKDIHILETFRDYLGYNNPIRTINKKKGCPNCSILKSLVVSSKKICTDLSKWGCVKAKSHFTYFPDIPEELWNHFIRGVFDGDGWIHKKIITMTIIGNKDLIVRIQEILVDKCQIVKNKLYIAHRCKENILEMRYSGSNLLSIRNYLYKDATVYLQRKYNRFYGN